MLTQEQILEARKSIGIPESGLSSGAINPAENVARRRLMASKYDQEQQVKEENPSFFSKLGYVGENIRKTGQALKFGKEAFIDPLARSIIRPGVEAVKATQSLIPGGKTGRETVSTPFGDITPRQIDEGLKGSMRGTMDVVELATAFIPVEKLVSPLFKFFGGVTKRTAGAITGKGTEVIEKILKYPETAKIGLRSDEVKLLKDMAGQASGEVVNLSKQAKTAFADSLNKLPNIKIELKNVVGSLSDKLSDFGVAIKKGNVLNFTESPFRKSDENVLQEVFSTINNWKDLTPKGLNNLAVKIGNFVKTGEQSNMLNSVINKTKQSLRTTIGDIIPEAKTMVSDYAEKMNFIDDLRDVLSVKDNTLSEAGLRKTATKIQQLFNSNKQLARDLVGEMAGGTEILAKEAGRQLAQAPSRAATTIGDAAMNLFQSVITPKVVGELTALTGITQQKIKPVIDVMQKLAPLERTALFEALTKILGNQDSQK